MRKTRRSALFSGKRSLPLKIALGVIILIILLVVLIPGKRHVPSSAEANAIRSRGILHVLVNAAPSDLYTDEGLGLEADIINRIGELIFGDDFDKAADVEFIRINSSFMDSYFNDATADIAIMQCPTGLYSSKYAYSTPYFTDTCLFIIGNDTADDMPLNGISIGVINGGICEDRLDSYVEKNKLTITKQKYPTYETMLGDLKSETISACVMQGTAYDEYAKGNFKTHSLKLESISYSVVCNKENEGLCDLLNAAIADVIK